MTGYPIALVIEHQICLLDYPNEDWEYDPNFDVVFPRPGSKLYTLLALLN